LTKNDLNLKALKYSKSKIRKSKIKEKRSDLKACRKHMFNTFGKKKSNL